MSDVFVTSHLKDLSDGDLALQLEMSADIFEDHQAYKGKDLPPWILGAADLRGHAVELKHASAAAKQEENKVSPRLVAAREKGIQGLMFAYQYVVMFAAHANDPTLLDNIGLETRHRSYARGALRKPEKPVKFMVKHTDSSGSIYAFVNSWEGKGSVELQICEGDPADEASWRTLNIFHSCRMRASGLEPAKRCYFRARILNNAGKSPWSEVVELIIL